MNKLTEQYIEFIKQEVQQLVDCRFTGNVDFKVNFKEGGIANINSVLSRSVKFSEDK